MQVGLLPGDTLQAMTRPVASTPPARRAFTQSGLSIVRDAPSRISLAHTPEFQGRDSRAPSNTPIRPASAVEATAQPLLLCVTPSSTLSHALCGNPGSVFLPLSVLFTCLGSVLSTKARPRYSIMTLRSLGS